MIVNISNKRKWFYTKKAKSRQYPTETITDANYPDDTALLTNTPDQAESLLHSLEKTAGGIGLSINVNKTEFMCFKKEPSLF